MSAHAPAVAARTAAANDAAAAHAARGWRPYRAVVPPPPDAPHEPAPDRPHWLPAGRLLALPEADAPVHEGRRRPLGVWLPPSYDANTARRYPVLYALDGQNSFDDATSFAGSWRLGATMARLAESGREAIVVLVPNAGEHRMHEYSPFPHAPHGGGGAAAYLDHLVDAVRPEIDSAFRTRVEPSATGLFGSSLGGLFALYAFMRRPDVFGLCGAFSPSLWFGRRRVFRMLRRDLRARRRAAGRGRIYLDVGTRERPDWWGSQRYSLLVRRLALMLRLRGYRRARGQRGGVARGDGHSEAVWAARAPAALAFLLATEESGSAA
ncbi:MAG: alpha/beta hydrolase-fold protein [Acidobacteriota bacterium]